MSAGSLVLRLTKNDRPSGTWTRLPLEMQPPATLCDEAAERSTPSRSNAVATLIASSITADSFLYMVHERIARSLYHGKYVLEPAELAVPGVGNVRRVPQ